MGKKITGDELVKRLGAARGDRKSDHGAQPVPPQKSSPRPFADLLNELGLAPPLVLISPHHIRIKRLVTWLKEQFFPAQSPSSQSGHGVFFGTELSGANLEHIIGALTSLSLFSQQEMIVLYDADKAKAAAQKTLVDALKRQVPSALLIITAASMNQRAPLLTEGVSRGTLVDLPDLKDQQLERWIDREVARIGLASGIAPDARTLLAQSYATDLTALGHEIEKLSLLTAGGMTIERSLAESISFRKSERTSIELVKQLAVRNRPGILAVTQDLLDQGLHPLQIAAFLSRAWRTMLGQVAGRSEGSSSLPSELTNPWFIRQLRPFLGSFSEKRLKTGIAILAGLDFRLKDSKLPPNVSLSLGLHHLTAAD